MGSSNETSFYGPVRNPWDTTAVPGGSSGGLRSSGCGPPGAGGDGHRYRRVDPPAGRVFRHLRTEADLWRGIALRHDCLSPPASTRPGPFARTAEDLALMLNAMAGFDARDSTSLQREPEDYAHDLRTTGARDCASACRAEFFRGGSSRRTSRGRSMQAIAEFRKLGCETVEVALPNMKLSVPVYYVLAPAEASSNLSRFDGVRYGYRAPDYWRPDRHVSRKTRAQGFGEEVKRRILDRHVRAVARLLRRLLSSRRKNCGG